MAGKIIIGILLIVLCALFGRALALNSVVEADAVRRIQEDISRLKMLTLENKLPAHKALAQLKEPVFRKMSERMTKDARLSLKEAWEKAAEEERVKSDAGKAIEMLLAALESLSRDQQSAQYDRAQDELKKHEEMKRKMGLEKVRLYTSLGAVSGVCLFLFCV